MWLKRMPFEITRQRGVIKSLEASSHLAKRAPDFMYQCRRMGPHRTQRQTTKGRYHPDYPIIARQFCNGGTGSPVMPANDTRHRQIRHGRSQMVERLHLHGDEAGITSRPHHFHNSIQTPVTADGDVQVKLAVKPFEFTFEPVMSLKILLPECDVLIRPHRRLR